MSRHAVLAATALLALASPALAQQPGHGTHGAGQHGMGMHGMHEAMGEMHGEGMALMRARPAALLEASDALGLTAEQVERLETLRDDVQAAHQRHMAAAMEARRAAAAALEADAPDLAGYEAALGEAAGHMVQAHVAETRAALEARALLTERQREALDAMTPGMHGGQGGHGAHRPGGAR